MIFSLSGVVSACRDRQSFLNDNLKENERFYSWKITDLL